MLWSVTADFPDMILYPNRTMLDIASDFNAAFNFLILRKRSFRLFYKPAEGFFAHKFFKIFSDFGKRKSVQFKKTEEFYIGPDKGKALCLFIKFIDCRRTCIIFKHQAFRRIGRKELPDINLAKGSWSYNG